MAAAAAPATADGGGAGAGAGAGGGGATTMVMTDLLEAPARWTSRRRRAWARRREEPARFLYYFTVTGRARAGEFAPDEVAQLREALRPFLARGWGLDEGVWGLVSVTMPGALRTGRQCRDCFLRRRAAFSGAASERAQADPPTRQAWIDDHLWGAKAALDTAQARANERKTVQRIARHQHSKQRREQEALSQPPRLVVVSQAEAPRLASRFAVDASASLSDEEDEDEDGSGVDDGRIPAVSDQGHSDASDDEEEPLFPNSPARDDDEKDADYVDPAADREDDEDGETTLAGLLKRRRSKAKRAKVDKADKSRKRKLVRPRRGSDASSADGSESEHSFRINKVQFSKVRASIVVSSDEDDDFEHNQDRALSRQPSSPLRPVSPLASSASEADEAADPDGDFLRGWDDEELAARPHSMSQETYNKLMSLGKKRARRRIAKVQARLDDQLADLERKLRGNLDGAQLERLNEHLRRHVQADLLDVTRVLLKRLEMLHVPDVQLLAIDAAHRNQDERVTVLQKRLRRLLEASLDDQSSASSEAVFTNEYDEDDEDDESDGPEVQDLTDGQKDAACQHSTMYRATDRRPESPGNVIGLGANEHAFRTAQRPQQRKRVRAPPAASSPPRKRPRNQKTAPRGPRSSEGTLRRWLESGPGKRQRSKRREPDSPRTHITAVEAVRQVMRSPAHFADDASFCTDAAPSLTISPTSAAATARRPLPLSAVSLQQRHNIGLSQTDSREQDSAIASVRRILGSADEQASHGALPARRRPLPLHLFWDEASASQPPPSPSEPEQSQSQTPTRRPNLKFPTRTLEEGARHLLAARNDASKAPAWLAYIDVEPEDARRAIEALVSVRTSQRRVDEDVTRRRICCAYSGLLQIRVKHADAVAWIRAGLCAAAARPWSATTACLLEHVVLNLSPDASTLRCMAARIIVSDTLTLFVRKRGALSSPERSLLARAARALGTAEFWATQRLMLTSSILHSDEPLVASPDRVMLLLQAATVAKGSPSAAAPSLASWKATVTEQLMRRRPENHRLRIADALEYTEFAWDWVLTAAGAQSAFAGAAKPAKASDEERMPSQPQASSHQVAWAIVEDLFKLSPLAGGATPVSRQSLAKWKEALTAFASVSEFCDLLLGRIALLATTLRGSLPEHMLPSLLRRVQDVAAHEDDLCSVENAQGAGDEGEAEDADPEKDGQSALDSEIADLLGLALDNCRNDSAKQTRCVLRVLEVFPQVTQPRMTTRQLRNYAGVLATMASSCTDTQMVGKLLAQVQLLKRPTDCSRNDVRILIEAIPAVARSGLDKEKNQGSGAVSIEGIRHAQRFLEQLASACIANSKLTDLAGPCILQMAALPQGPLAEAAGAMDRTFRLVLYTGHLRPRLLIASLRLAKSILAVAAAALPKFSFVEDHAPFPAPPQPPVPTHGLNAQSQQQAVTAAAISSGHVLTASPGGSLEDLFASVNEDAFIIQAQLRKRAELVESLVRAYRGFRQQIHGNPAAMRSLSALTAAAGPHLKSLAAVATAQPRKALCDVIGSFAALAVRYSKSPGSAKQALDAILRDPNLDARTATALLDGLHRFGCLDAFLVPQYAEVFVTQWMTAVADARACDEHLFAQRLAALGMLWVQAQPDNLAINVAAALQGRRGAYFEQAANGIRVWWARQRSNRDAARRLANDMLLRVVQAVEPSPHASACFAGLLDVLGDHDLFRLPSLVASQNALDQMIRKHVQIVGDVDLAVACIRQASDNGRDELLRHLIVRFALLWRDGPEADALSGMHRVRREVEVLADQHDAVAALRRRLCNAPQI